MKGVGGAKVDTHVDITPAVYCVSPLLPLQYYCCSLVGTLLTVVIS